MIIPNQINTITKLLTHHSKALFGETPSLTNKSFYRRDMPQQLTPLDSREGTTKTTQENNSSKRHSQKDIANPSSLGCNSLSPRMMFPPAHLPPWP